MSESEHISDPNEENRGVDLSPQSCRSAKNSSRASSTQKEKHKKNVRDRMLIEGGTEGGEESRSETRICQSDLEQDHSDGDGRRRSVSCYSDDHDNESPSESYLSTNSQSWTHTPSPSRRRGVHAKRTAGAAGRRGVSRPQRPGVQPQQPGKGVRSQSKESVPPKDLDLVTKRMLSARLLKINELRNALAELQLRVGELQKENQILKKLMVRQEKALQRYDDTESEISQLLARHSNETHVLRERLRRTQERERAAERRLKDSEEQLHRSQAAVARMKKLIGQRELGARDELSRKLEEERARAQEADRRIRELERNMELSNSSYQRQLAAERKKTVSAQECSSTLQDELKRLSDKLKEKERELDVSNIYTQRMGKPPLKKETDSARRLSSRNSTKAVQTEGRRSSPDFPTPPPAVSEFSEPAPDGYLSLKEPDGAAKTEDRRQNGEQQPTGEEKEKEQEEEKQRLQDGNVLEEKKLRDEDDTKRTHLSRREGGSDRRVGHVRDEVERWNQEAVANRHAAEAATFKKEQLLAKMKEIDRQSQGVQSASGCHQNASSESEGSGSVDAGRRRTGVDGGVGRRAVRSQTSTDNLAFGGYAPSFGHPSPRCSPGFPSPPPKEDRESALEAIGVITLRDKPMDRAAVNDRKSGLMQQLFGAVATPAGEVGGFADGTDILRSPPATNGVRPRRAGLLGFTSGSSSPRTSNTLHVTDSRPSVHAITSFDDDIEELTL